MKITRRQLRNLIFESIEQEQTPKQKLLALMASGIEGLRQADMLADSLGIDLFPIFADVDYGSSNDAIMNTLGPYINQEDFDKFMWSVADNTVYEAGFLKSLFDKLPNFPSLSLNMTGQQIEDLINNDGGEYEYYENTEAHIGLQFEHTIARGTGDPIVGTVKYWLCGIWFLRIKQIREMQGSNFNLVETIESLFGGQ